MKKTILLIVTLFLLYPQMTYSNAILPKFSLDPASPSIGTVTASGTITPDDILIASPLGPVVLTEGSSLGLQDDFFGGLFDNLDALSYGRDPVTRPGTTLPVDFSVDRLAVGLPGSAVNEQAQLGIESAAGDVFMTLPHFASNSLAIQGASLGLKPGFFGDDLDALDLDTADTSRIYFSIDFLSPSDGLNSGDIFLNVFGNVFASGELDIGLDQEDDLDALALWDVVNPGVLDPGKDLALFSLSVFSPSAFTYSGKQYDPGVKGSLSPADILFTDFTGGFSLWASAADIGLRPDDELNALDTVPEPSTLLLIGTGLLGLGFCRNRIRRAKSQLKSI